MKKISLLFIFTACFLEFACLSPRQTQESVSAPKWITDKGRLELFPSSSYVSALAHGDTAQVCREKAVAEISEYIKASVSSSSAAAYFYKQSDNVFSENQNLRQKIQVFSNNDLYQLEYTNPYYETDRAQYVCVAYINREWAFDFVRPKLDAAKNQFAKNYNEALKKQSLLDKIIGIKRAQKILPVFYEVWDFARAILPEKARVYEEVDFLANESLHKVKELSSSVLIRIEDIGNTDLLEKSGVVAELSNQFKKIGFVVSDSKNANCSALVEAKAPINERDGIFETYPEIYIKIMEHEIEKISSAKSLDRVSALDKDTFIARIYLALKNEVKTLIEDEFFN